MKERLKKAQSYATEDWNTARRRAPRTNATPASEVKRLIERNDKRGHESDEGRRVASLRPQSDDGGGRLLRATAYHEAGHAVVGHYFGKWVRERGLRIGLSGEIVGHADLRGELLCPLSVLPNEAIRCMQKRLRAECLELLAGMASEQRAMRWKQNGAAADVSRAVHLIQTVTECDPRIAQLELFVIHLPATRRLIRRPDIWKAIELIAQPLERRKYISSDEASQLLEQSGLKSVQWNYWERL